MTFPSAVHEMGQMNISILFFSPLYTLKGNSDIKHQEKERSKQKKKTKKRDFSAFFFRIPYILPRSYNNIHSKLFTEPTYIKLYVDTFIRLEPGRKKQTNKQSKTTIKKGERRSKSSVQKPFSFLLFSSPTPSFSFFFGPSFAFFFFSKKKKTKTK